MNDEKDRPNLSRWLSKDLSSLIQKQQAKDDIYDVIIVGSGYGGAMAAAELAGAKNENSLPISMCILERGKEYLPGAFPSQLAELPGHVRVSGHDAEKPIGNGDALLDVRLGEDVCALLANGLGGGSLINAGVMKEPDWANFTHKLPPTVVEHLKRHAGLVKEKLGVAEKINQHPSLAKQALKKTQAMQALDGSAKTFELAELSIALREPGDSPAKLKKCSLCGDCLTGCNVGAKKSLDTNLLLKARQHGAEIYTGAAVLQLNRTLAEDKKFYWQLKVVYTDEAVRKRQKSPLFLRAKHIILAAGALGSPEILMRSESKNLRFSARLGQQFSCNGDNIATFYRLKTKVNAVANENTALTSNGSAGRNIGPTITSTLDVKKSHAAGFLLQEFSIPGPLKKLFEEIVTTSNVLYKLSDVDKSQHHPAQQNDGQLDPCAVDAESIQHSMLVGIIGHDAANGVLRLPAAQRDGRRKHYNGMLHIDWPDARNSEQLKQAMQQVKLLGKGKYAQDGRLLPNPLWQQAPPGLEFLFNQPKGPVLTVHPLGGCAIGSDLASGVVDDAGRVFDALKLKHDAWQNSLVVLDGSIVPTSLGANPALTIAGLSLRASALLAQSWGWQLRPANSAPSLDVSARGVFRPPEDCTSEHVPTEIKMSERLFGDVEIFSEGGLGARKYVAELTLRYQAVALEDLMQAMYRKITLAENKEGQACSQLRIFDHEQWQSLQFASEAERNRHAWVTADLQGELRIFNREKSQVLGRAVRSGVAWARNRGIRDLSQMVVDYFKPDEKLSESEGLFAKSKKFTCNLVKLLSHAGEIRRLDYVLQIGKAKVRPDSPIFRQHQIENTLLKGEKRLTYNCRANPLRQLIELKLTEFPAMLRQSAPILRLDMRFIAMQEIPLAQIVKQKNQVNALADLASFGMLVARIVLNNHVWTFRKPDTMPERTAERLPAKLPGLIRSVTEIELGKPRDGIPVRVRLTRYVHANLNPELCPLVMLHGYSASGTTFAHHAIGTSMAEYFAKQGRDVWILDLRTSAGMPSAVLPWSFEDAALEDIPVAIAHIIQVTGQPKVDVFAHCIGAVMLSMAILLDPEHIEDALPIREGSRKKDRYRRYTTELKQLPLSIRRIVLSQKGPALVYTQDNAVRAYLMRFLRRLALPDDYQFSIGKNPSLRDQLMDRLLNILPYSDEEYDRENPLELLNLAKRTPWVGFRHRMDALYAQDFKVSNISDHTLDYIADLFGPLNLDTVAQSIHFVRYDKITNASGHNTFVNRQNLKNRWAQGKHSSIECTMSIHGAENGLADKETLHRMQNLMQDAGIAFIPKLFKGMGHQDMLIGERNTEVFAAIEQFLQRTLQISEINNSNPALYALPWLGPRFSPQNAAPDAIWSMADPLYGRAHALYIPVDFLGNADYQLAAALPNNSVVTSSEIEVNAWSRLQLPASLPDCAGIIIVHCYDAAADRREALVEDTDIVVKPAAPKPHASSFHKAELASILRQIKQQYSTEELGSAFIAFDRLQKKTGSQDHATSLSFAFASCQYPAGILDRPLAEASLSRLANRLRPYPAAVTKIKPEFVLFLGDQIYSDATAGLLDPTRADDRYRRPHEEWLSMPPMREVMRQLPVYCMLDDHEIIDNWQGSEGDNWYLDQGSAFFQIYQPRANDGGTNKQELWQFFQHNGFAFFMADTRAERTPRHAGNTATAEIMKRPQMDALKAWLSCSKLRDKPKIISSASAFLPRHLANADDFLSLDSWDAYPASLYELLAYIADEEIEHVVFLSGDEHLSFVSSIELHKKDKIIKLHSIHSSALYAPLPFANALAAEIPAFDTFNFDRNGQNYACSSNTKLVQKGDGYMLAKLQASADQSWLLHLEFDGAEGSWNWQAKI